MGRKIVFLDSVVTQGTVITTACIQFWHDLLGRRFQVVIWGWLVRAKV